MLRRVKERGGERKEWDEKRGVGVCGGFIY